MDSIPDSTYCYLKKTFESETEETSQQLSAVNHKLELLNSTIAKINSLKKIANYIFVVSFFLLINTIKYFVRYLQVQQQSTCTLSI